MSARLSIGALSKATGVPAETLRTWEARYGFPAPERKPSGHRLYPLAAVARLKRISEALNRGHRAGQVVAISEDELARLLDTVPQPEGPAAVTEAAPATDLLAAIARFDAERLTRALLTDWARLGPLDFLETRVAPLVRAVGTAWEDRRLDVRHEHFASERIGDVLRTLRLPFEERARGPLVVMATLPGETHGLGLQMAGLVLSQAGCRVLYLGTEVPTGEILQMTRDLNARALALSVSLSSRGAATARQVKALREKLPRRTSLLVGGEGAPPSRGGVHVFADLRTLDAWARASTA